METQVRYIYIKMLSTAWIEKGDDSIGVVDMDVKHWLEDLRRKHCKQLQRPRIGYRRT